MAKVVITIEDNEAGNIIFRIESTPPFPGPAAGKEHQTTAAQRLGMTLLEVVNDSLDYDQVGEPEYGGVEYADPYDSDPDAN